VHRFLIRPPRAPLAQSQVGCSLATASSAQEHGDPHLSGAGRHHLKGGVNRAIALSFDELIQLGLVEPKAVKFFGAQATGCSPISTAVKAGTAEFEPQKPATLARSLAIGNPADGTYAIKTISKTGGWAEDVSDPEIVESIQLLAETEGIFTETAGGVTTGCARKLYQQGRIAPEETTVLCITGNGLKTTDVLAGSYELEDPIRPKVAEFETLLQRSLEAPPVEECRIW